MKLVSGFIAGALASAVLLGSVTSTGCNQSKPVKAPETPTPATEGGASKTDTASKKPEAGGGGSSE